MENSSGQELGKSVEQLGNNLKTFSGYLPVLTVISYLYAIIETYCYYALFGINVMPFLDFTEVLQQALAGMISTVAGFGLVFVFYMALYSTFKQYGVDEHKAKKSITTIFKGSKVGYIIALISCIIIIISILLILSTNDPKTFLWSLASFITCTGLSIPPLVVFCLQDRIEFKYIVKVFFVTLMVSSLCVISLIGSVSKAIDVRIKKLTVGSYIKVSGKTVTSTPEYFYIGSTNKFVFFFDNSIKRTVAYQISDITEMGLKESRFTLK